MMMVADPQANHPLRRWLSALVEDSLYVRVGMCDPEVAQYLVDLMMDFIHVDHIFALRDARGRPIDQVADMLAESLTPVGLPESDHRRMVHKHIGDFTLYWTGVYPEGLRRIGDRCSKDRLIDYLSHGKRSYAIASELSDEQRRPPAHVLRRLSDEFETCVYGLSLVRRGWEERDPAGFRSARTIWT